MPLGKARHLDRLCPPVITKGSSCRYLRLCDAGSGRRGIVLWIPQLYAHRGMQGGMNKGQQQQRCSVQHAAQRTGCDPYLCVCVPGR